MLVDIMLENNFHDQYNVNDFIYLYMHNYAKFAYFRKYPGEKVVGWYKFRQPGLLIRDPEIIHKVLVTDFNSFRNNDIDITEDVDPILGKNIFALKDEM